MKCPCDFSQTYEHCCKPYHLGELAPTPERLMRSRYSAYALNITDYLMKTWHSSTCPEELAEPDELLQWIKLIIMDSQFDDEKKEGLVTFEATYRINGHAPQKVAEKSRFIYENDRLVYIDGEPH